MLPRGAKEYVNYTVALICRKMPDKTGKRTSVINLISAVRFDSNNTKKPTKYMHKTNV